MNTLSMTKGKPFKLLLSFALPLILGNVFQQAYTLVDTIIVGQGVGVKALASLGAGDWLNWMILGIIQGFTQGCSIEISQAYGANNQKRLKESIFHSLILSFALIVVITIGSLLIMKPVLYLLDTPADVFDGTVTYLTVMFLGTIFVTLYNLFASLLRGFGNAKVPLMAMIIASINNIVLDYIFIYFFHMGIFGAALATIISQGLAALICFISLNKIVEINFQQSIIWNRIIHLLKLGAPIAMQILIICIGGMIVQKVVNGFGFVFVAGFTATNKLYGLLEIAAISFGYSISTFTGQNLGALKINRIKQGIKDGIIFSIIVSLLISLLMFIFGKAIINLFIASSSKSYNEVVQVAWCYLRVMSICLPILYFLHLYKNALQGLGNTFQTMVSGIVEFSMRVFAALLLPIVMGQSGIFYAEVLAWGGATLYLTIGYYLEIKKITKKYKESKSI